MTRCLILTYLFFILEQKLCSWSLHGPRHAYKIHEDRCSVELSQSLGSPLPSLCPSSRFHQMELERHSVSHITQSFTKSIPGLMKNPQLCVCDKPLHTSRHRDQEIENRARERDSDRVKFENSQQLISAYHRHSKLWRTQTIKIFNTQISSMI